MTKKPVLAVICGEVSVVARVSRAEVAYEGGYEERPGGGGDVGRGAGDDGGRDECAEEIGTREGVEECERQLDGEGEGRKEGLRELLNEGLGRGVECRDEAGEHEGRRLLEERGWAASRGVARCAGVRTGYGLAGVDDDEGRSEVAGEAAGLGLVALADVLGEVGLPDLAHDQTQAHGRGEVEGADREPEPSEGRDWREDEAIGVEHGRDGGGEGHGRVQYYTDLLFRVFCRRRRVLVLIALGRQQATLLHAYIEMSYRSRNLP